MKARCRRCYYLNLDFIDLTYEDDCPPFCGLHGRSRIDPDGEQPDLDHHGGCGFSPKEQEYQLSMFNEDYEDYEDYED